MDDYTKKANNFDYSAVEESACCSRRVAFDTARQHLPTIEAFDSLDIRFSRKTLISNLKSYIKTIQSTPIEYYEIELFQATKIFHKELHSKQVDIKCIEKIHHVQKLIKDMDSLDDDEKILLDDKVRIFITLHPLITKEYDLFNKLLEIINGLLLK